MQRESTKVLKHTKSVQVLTEAVAENFAVLTGVRPDVGSEAPLKRAFFTIQSVEGQCW